MALASPLDFLFTTLVAGGIVALVASSFEQWRQSRLMRVRVLTLSRPARLAAFASAQLVAGAAVGGLVVGYESFIRTRLSQSSVDVLHFSLHPLDGARLPVVAGLVVAHAALAALAVLILRVAIARWVVPAQVRWIRAWIPILWAVPALFIARSALIAWERPPYLPAAVIVAFVIAAAWRLRRYRARLAHASQAARLAALFVALALPSLVFYPSLVDAAGRSRRQLVETHYAPEVSNQRRTGADRRRPGTGGSRQRSRAGWRWPAIHRGGVPRVVRDGARGSTAYFLGRALRPGWSARQPFRAETARISGRPDLAGGVVRVGSVRGSVALLC
jgi:hypothetical protein